MTLVKRKTKAKASTKAKRSNPLDLESLIDQRVTIDYKYGSFSGPLKYSKDTRKNYYMSVDGLATTLNSAFISFKPSDVKSIHREEGYYFTITLL